MNEDEILILLDNNYVKCKRCSCYYSEIKSFKWCKDIIQERGYTSYRWIYCPICVYENTIDKMFRRSTNIEQDIFLLQQTYAPIHIITYINHKVKVIKK